MWYDLKQEKQMKPGKLISVKTAARRIGVTPMTIRRWIHSGKMTAYMSPGGTFRVRAADCDVWRPTK